MPENVVPCRSCGAPVRWRVHVATGRPAPLDAEPNPAGNAVLVDGGAYELAPAAAGDLELVPRDRYMPHFATCPEAAEWRGKARS